MLPVFSLLLLALVVGRCVWELRFAREPLFEHPRPLPLFLGLAALCSLVTPFLVLETVPADFRSEAVALLLVVTATFWISHFAKKFLPAFLNFLLRLVLAGGCVLQGFAVWQLRGELQPGSLFVSGVLALVPLVHAGVLLAELLHNAAHSHGHARFALKCLAESGGWCGVSFLLLKWIA